MAVDYYKILEVERNTSPEGFKKAYRKLALKYHPDRNPGDKEAEARFKQINEAYDVLKDEQKRAAYDRYGHAAFGAGESQAGNFHFSGGLGDIFEQMFGDVMGRGRSTRVQHGDDIHTQIEVELTEAFSGVKKNVTFATKINCDSCRGTGSSDKIACREACPSCRGSGKVRAQQGFFLVEHTCPSCLGKGFKVANPCKICGGEGTQPRQRTLEIQIPVGIEDGTRIRLSGEGEAAGSDAPAGDLYVTVTIAPHSLFQRDGSNIYCRVPIRMTQAALGDEIEVPVIDGSKVKVRIPPGTQNSEQFRLKHKGFSVLRSSSRGDMYIQVAVEIPRKITKKQQEILKKFDEESSVDSDTASPDNTGFFSRVREFFENFDQRS